MTSRAALLTGGGQRVGAAMVQEVARAGYAVAIHYRRAAAPARALAAAIEAQGGRAHPLQADLSDEAATETLVDQAAAVLGPISLLINNAAVFAPDRPASVSRQSWDRHMAINLRAPMILTQALLRQLPDDTPGQVINMIDQRVWNLTPNYTSYTVSKVALWGLTRHLALALAPRIRVNAIGPGLVEGAASMADDAFRAWCRAMPLERATTMQEICNALRFLLETPSITGQMIALDSGFHLGWLHPRQPS